MNLNHGENSQLFAGKERKNQPAMPSDIHKTRLGRDLEVQKARNLLLFAKIAIKTPENVGIPTRSSISAAPSRQDKVKLTIVRPPSPKEKTKTKTYSYMTLHPTSPQQEHV
jgi:hypothetical protein